MNGNNKDFFTMMRKIRRDSQRGGRYNKLGKLKDSMKASGQFTDRMKEDKTLFSWKQPGGCDTDWTLEINHLGVAISFLEGVREKMKHIAVEEMKVVHIEMERYVKRLEYMLERTTNDVRVDWVNAETQMSILSQHGYKKDSARLSDMGKTSTDKDEKITGRIEKLLQHGKVEKLDYSGFE